MKYIFIFLLITASQVFAAEWTQIYKDKKSGVKVYASESFILEDGTLRVFLKTSNDKKINGKPFAILVNCENRTVRDFIPGELGAEFFKPWAPLTPDSFGEMTFNAFCKNILKRKEELSQEKLAQEKIQKETEALLQAELKQNGYSLTSKSNTYLGRLRARVRPNITFSDSQLQAVKGNPEAEIEVICSSTGEILGRKLTRSSGYLAWDEAVLNAIEKTGTLPRDENGNMPPKISFVFRPRD